jgi:hypothetical protein
MQSSSARFRRIDVSWKTDVCSAKNQLCIRWRETGITIESAPARRGSGLEKSVPYVLRGTFERTIHHDGVECVIAFPLEPDLNDERPNHC